LLVLTCAAFIAIHEKCESKENKKQENKKNKKQQEKTNNNNQRPHSQSANNTPGQGCELFGFKL